MGSLHFNSKSYANGTMSVLFNSAVCVNFSGLSGKKSHFSYLADIIKFFEFTVLDEVIIYVSITVHLRI